MNQFKMFMELFLDSQDHQELIKGVVKGAGDLGAEVKPIFDAAGDYIVERNIKSFEKYTDAGLLRDEALSLIINDNQKLKKLINNLANALK